MMQNIWCVEHDLTTTICKAAAIHERVIESQDKLLAHSQCAKRVEVILVNLWLLYLLIWKLFIMVFCTAVTATAVTVRPSSPLASRRRRKTANYLFRIRVYLALKKITNSIRRSTEANWYKLFIRWLGCWFSRIIRFSSGEQRAKKPQQHLVLTSLWLWRVTGARRTSTAK